MKYTVTGHATVVCSMVVEANTEKEAIELANKMTYEKANRRDIFKNVNKTFRDVYGTR